MTVLEASNIERHFGAARVLCGVSLVVNGGECHLVAGPNGAGKTTLLRTLAGLARPAAGSVTVAGESLLGTPLARRHIGFLSHQSQLYHDLTAAENLEFAARLHGLSDPGVARARLAAVGLADRADDQVGRLSRGMVQRVAVARALLHEPRLLLLDEPFTGLDAAAAERTLRMLRAERDAGRGLVLVTHDPGEAWEIATHAHLLVGGRWQLSGPRPASLDEFLRLCREAAHG